MSHLYSTTERMWSIDVSAEVLLIKRLFGQFLEKSKLIETFQFESVLRNEHFWENELMLDAPGWGIWDRTPTNYYLTQMRPLVNIKNYGHLYQKEMDDIGRIYFRSTKDSPTVADKDQYEAYLMDLLEQDNLYDKDFNPIHMHPDARLATSPSADLFIYHLIRGYFSILLSIHSPFKKRYPNTFDFVDYLFLFLKEAGYDKETITYDWMCHFGEVHDINTALEEAFDKLIALLEGSFHHGEWMWQVLYIISDDRTIGLAGEMRINIASQGDYRILDWMQNNQVKRTRATITGRGKLRSAME